MERWQIKQIDKDVIRWGNSAGVLLPREWLGNQVKVILIDRTLEIKKEVFNILDKYLEDIIGVYLVGSYARREEEENSDIDVIAISKSTKKEIISGRYNISIITLKGAEKTIERNPVLILPRLNEAKVILNRYLLEELKSIKFQKNAFKEFIEESKRIIKISKSFITIDRDQEYKNLDSISIIYSLILRLRGIFLIRNILNKEKYSKKEFLRWMNKEIDSNEIERVYNVYTSIRDDKKVKEKIKIETAEKLLNFLEKEVPKLENETKKKIGKRS